MVLKHWLMIVKVYVLCLSFLSPYARKQKKKASIQKMFGLKWLFFSITLVSQS